ncbi:hypothetical protein E2C01_004702 [Portunus trituberculatus]|uniref:Uncharacterized protein n=1 Tax=Portunus trituberculatus TaxID=210409 RepID=A0A5B7CS27_PORTR|nr:hypothetical protein [Portunus trituberculatus]
MYILQLAIVYFRGRRTSPTQYSKHIKKQSMIRKRNTDTEKALEIVDVSDVYYMAIDLQHCFIIVEASQLIVRGKIAPRRSRRLAGTPTLSVDLSAPIWVTIPTFLVGFMSRNHLSEHVSPDNSQNCSTTLVFLDSLMP